MKNKSNHKPFEVIPLRTYNNSPESTSTLDFEVPKAWLENVLKEDNKSIEEFLTEYTWDHSEAIKIRAIAENVFIGEDETFPEWCPNCEYEVELENRFVVQQCPNCGDPILPCDQCLTTDCANCPLEKSLVMKKLILELEDSIEFMENLSELIGTEINGEGVIKKQNLILEAQTLLDKKENEND